MAHNDYFITRETCPGCRSARVRTLFACDYLAAPVKDYLEWFYTPGGRIEFDYLTGAEFVLQDCADCGLVFQRDVPGDFLAYKLYEEWLGAGGTLNLAAEKDYSFQLSLHIQQLLMVVALLGGPPSRLTVLDFGMGWGQWCRAAQLFGCETYGTELSQWRIDYARRYGVNTLTAEELPGYRFDFINTEQVFEHLTAPLDTLRSLCALLKPGGLLKIGVPDGGDIRRRLRIGDWHAPKDTPRSLNAVSPLEHINCFSRRALIAMAAQEKLVPVDIPLRIQYAFSMPWLPLRRGVRALLRPLARNVLHKGTTLFFRRGQV